MTNGSGPVSGAKISVTVNGNKIDKYSGADGKASFANLPVGNYTFDVTCTGYESKSESVTIARNTTSNVSLTINKIITAQVNVKDGAGNNVAWNASVRVTGNGVDQTKTTDASGNVTFSLPAGQYLFAAAYTYDGYYSNDSKTILLSDETSSVNLTMVRKVGSLTLIVKDKASQQPISGVEITKSYTDDVLGYTDGDGKLTLNDVPTGSYYYTARKVGYQGMINGVDVNEGTNEKEIVLSSLPGKARVAVKSGTTTLVGAKVFLEDGSSKDTNVYGNAIFESVPSGEVVFRASKPGYASKTVVATIAPGNTYTDVEINLAPLDP